MSDCAAANRASKDRRRTETCPAMASRPAWAKPRLSKRNTSRLASLRAVSASADAGGSTGGACPLPAGAGGRAGRMGGSGGAGLILWGQDSASAFGPEEDGQGGRITGAGWALKIKRRSEEGAVAGAPWIRANCSAKAAVWIGTPAAARQAMPLRAPRNDEPRSRDTVRWGRSPSVLEIQSEQRLRGPCSTKMRTPSRQAFSIVRGKSTVFEACARSRSATSPASGTKESPRALE